MGDSEIVKDPTQKQDQTPSQQESSLGKEYIRLGGVLAIMAYLVLFAAADLYVVAKIWPPAPRPAATPTPTPSAQTATSPAPGSSSSPVATQMPAARMAATAASPAPQPSPSASPVGGEKQAAASPNPSPAIQGEKPAATSEQDQGPWPVEFFWGTKYQLSLNETLFLIVIFCGAMGALVRALRSFFWYIGMRELKWSWAAMYILLPFVGALIGTVFYLLVRGGLTSTLANVSSVYGYAAISALVGLFSDEAILQLKQIANKILTPAEQGRDAAPQHAAAPPSAAAPPPKISGVSPATGIAAGSTSVVIKGDNFNQGAKVNLGGTSATVGVITKGSIAITTPAHTVGAVDVEVVNADGQKDILRGGFTYQ